MPPAIPMVAAALWAVLSMAACRTNGPLHTVSVTIRPEQAGKVHGIRGQFDDNTAVLEVEANDGYAFYRWSEQSRTLSTNHELRLDLPHDRAIVVEFVEVIDVNGISINMVSIDGGEFDMGAQADSPLGTNYDPLATKYEVPVHRVRLDSYKIGQTEVTQQLWQAVMGSNPSHVKGDRLPVEGVSWNDIVNDFLPKLNALTGRRFRLPTEAEWEYAARGASQTRGMVHPGSSNLRDVAWFEANSEKRLQLVGQLMSNELGLYDMCGNVWEWCADYYARYSADAQTNPAGPRSGSERVLRGGSWYNAATRCRVSERDSYRPNYRFNDVGFRLAL
ncbi:MAG: formylglycine-generating enzyme family protein [Bacteroidales bacterium]|nr:formylglycine-generating enzyme family protein [Bacteroidales bacterium]